jgi:hypothetical protein
MAEHRRNSGPTLENLLMNIRDSLYAKMDEPISSPFEQRLTNDPEALELCRWFAAYRDAQTTFDDHDLGELFEIFMNGVSAAKDLTAGELAERLECDIDGTVDEFLAAIRKERDEA